MEPRPSAMGSPPTALLIDCVAPGFAGFDSGRAQASGWRRDRGGIEEVVGRARGGLMGIHGDPL